jgi:hypothetical protein
MGAGKGALALAIFQVNFSSQKQQCHLEQVASLKKRSYIKRGSFVAVFVVDHRP